MGSVALRKESVDRNPMSVNAACVAGVALRKESVDRNWCQLMVRSFIRVALRKESVDRNLTGSTHSGPLGASLSARRAWIEILAMILKSMSVMGRSPQGERG